MTNKNNTRRALFLSAVSMFLCIVMLAGSTYAWFTDTVEVKTSRIEAGVLDVELEYTNDAVSGTWVNVEDIDPTLTYAPFFLDADGNKILWEPGVVSYANFKVINAGNRALQYDFSAIAAAFNKVADTGDDLTQAVKVGVLEHTTSPALYAREALLDLVKTSTISWTDFTLDSLRDVLLEGGDEDYFTLVLYWEPTAEDNRWNLQNGKLSDDGEPLFIDVDIKLVATQVEHEKDSIDDKYDEGAELPVIVKDAGALANALDTAVPGTTIELAPAVEYGIVQIDGELKDVTIDVDPTAVVEFNFASTADVENVTISGFDVTYEKTSGAYVDGGIVNIDAGASVKNLVIEDAIFNGSGGRSAAIGVSEPSAEVTLKNCTISGPKYVAYASAPFAKFALENCTIENVSSWVVLGNAGDSVGTEVIISGNTFDNCTGGIAKFLGSALADGANIVFTNNTLTGCTGHDGADAKWFAIPGDAEDITVSGNTLDGAVWTPGTAQGLGK